MEQEPPTTGQPRRNRGPHLVSLTRRLPLHPLDEALDLNLAYHILISPITNLFLPSRNHAQPNEECITAFNELKLNKKYKYIIYKLSDDYKEIVVEDASADKDWETFREKLINATSKTKSVRFHLAEQQWTAQDVMGWY
ncbi:Cofilin-like protein [Hapsidospora chrysogenum ATCC 11550]|uniref:Cofilin-like protein n=1 Tax=Hapsidospora chrysogenum (strain ATCC 11550 / CBS 779.69 / DSM 880 / IAM 14645 / JCM 23072 / IMI 49137) TaxID=857340 RepID=A0A086SWZ5_HAPC1|nr:Cofilin-like protein [Hapsidospora chrysogenum ATCC 11550]